VRPSLPLLLWSRAAAAAVGAMMAQRKHAAIAKRYC
jgi:hypothetical protein